MAKKSAKRDSDYYLQRIRISHPAVYADYRSGKLSARQATAKAGLIRLPTPLDGLLREWKRATSAQRGSFLSLIKASLPIARISPTSRSPSIKRISPAATSFILDWLRSNKAKPGSIMKEMGFSNFDYRLAEALNHNSPIHPEIEVKLLAWLRKRGFK